MAAPMGDNAEVFCPCDDILHFEDALKKLRVNDDKLIYQFNTILPTQSFQQKVNSTEQCKTLYEQMTRLYGGREKAIEKCVNQTTAEVEEWRQKRLNDRNDPQAMNMLRQSQQKLRLMERELTIDKAIKERSYKLFYERCRNSYTPPNRPIV